MEKELTFQDLGLPEALLAALDQKGYGYPTRVQAEAIPPLMAWKDVIAKADSLRDAGYDVNLIVEKKKVGKQINHCEEQGYAGFMVYGRDTDVRFFDGE